jgi:molybdate/tungstate transport system permease protein
VPPADPPPAPPARAPAPAAGGLRGAAAGAAAALAGGALLLFLVAPVAGVVAAGGAAGARALAADPEVRAALALSALAALGATAAAALLGTPLAWLLARGRVPARGLVEALLDLPLVLPHPVAGIALLLVLGRRAPAGAALLDLGVRVVGTPLGTACAMLFVAAPLYVSAARASFAQVDAAHELTARTLGAGPWRAFRRVSVPLAGRGLLAGAVVTWARAVSEFGAVVVLAYHPRTAATLAYERFTGYGLAEALPVAAALAFVALVPLAALRALRPRA